MIYTVALVVFLGSITVFFTQEIANVLKKVFAAPGMPVVIPLLLASSLIAYYEDWVVWGLLAIKTLLHRMASLIASWLPFNGALLVANILVLMICSVLPVAVANFWVKHKRFESFNHAFFINMLLWLLLTILLTVSYSYS
ncbi:MULTISPECIES: hypothetical protein [unclassified Legionella]|uniref:hypothetical protein n=1 Tax=unclassified Legionella TaxID=2622702 RepID=UPI001055F0E0|nr:MULTISPECIES: hypothetical protein [unclassified Legionella]MDI9819738.1 hypothetical protein [Legionella sp. PL877]